MCYNGLLIGEEFFMDSISRSDIILMLSVKGYFTTDALMKMSDEVLDNLYIEYVVLEEDYV
jgi:hypothetical protein